MNERTKNETDWARTLAGFRDRWRAVARATCLESNQHCVGPVIRAHAVQNALLLEQLATDGHVWMFQFTERGIRLESVGRNKATTFAGYCAFHDNQLFRAIDFKAFDEFRPEDASQLARFAIRAVAREYWLKLNAMALYREIALLAGAGRRDDLKRRLYMTEEETQYLMESYRFILLPSITGSEVTRSRLERSYKSLRTLIEAQDLHLWNFVSRAIPCLPSVAATASFYLEFDARGAVVGTRELHEDTPLMVLNVVPMGNTTWVLIAHHRRFKARLATFVADFKGCDDEEFRVLVSRMLIIYCENTVLARNAVDAIPDEERRTLERLFLKTAFYDAVPFHEAPRVDVFLPT